MGFKAGELRRRVFGRQGLEPGSCGGWGATAAAAGRLLGGQSSWGGGWEFRVRSLSDLVASPGGGGGGPAEEAPELGPGARRGSRGLETGRGPKPRIGGRRDTPKL